MICPKGYDPLLEWMDRAFALRLERHWIHESRNPD